MRLLQIGLIGAVALFGVGFGASPAFGQLGESELKEIIMSAPDAANRLVGKIQYVELEEGEDDSVTLSVKANTEYWIHGVCDDDCDDLDLEVRNSDGRLLGDDDEDDDSPIVVIKSLAAQELRVRVSMAECSEDICLAAVAMFEDE